MVDVEFVGQLVDSMEDAVLRLDRTVEKGNVDEENKLRVFIFDLHRKIDEVIGVKKKVDEKARRKSKRKSKKEGKIRRKTKKAVKKAAKKAKRSRRKHV